MRQHNDGVKHFTKRAAFAMPFSLTQGLDQRRQIGFKGFLKVAWSTDCRIPRTWRLRRRANNVHVPLTAIAEHPFQLQAKFHWPDGTWPVY